jgi:hypothetical protein
LINALIALEFLPDDAVIFIVVTSDQWRLHKGRSSGLRNGMENEHHIIVE